MNPFYKCISVLFICLTINAASHAETDQKPMAPMGDMKMNQGMGMGMQHGMGMTDEQRDQHLRSYQEHMLMMHDLSNQILSEKDPQKKEQLKNKQLELMKAHQDKMMEHRMQRMMPHQQKMQPGETKGSQ